MINELHSINLYANMILTGNDHLLNLNIALEIHTIEASQSLNQTE